MAAPQAFWAFISYSHADERHARWLHAWLEAYRTPKKLLGDGAGPSRTDPSGTGPSATAPFGTGRPARLRPIYRDREEFSAGQHLGQHIRQALDNARNLIVVCSPSAVRSAWVHDEIRHFQSLGRADRIFCLVVDGDPHAVDGPAQCMPMPLRSAPGEAGADALAADMRPGKDKPRLAALRIAAGLLDVRFDDLRQRDQERRLRQLSMISGGAVALLAVMASLTIVAFRQSSEAQHQRGEAQTQARIATDQRQRAETQQQRAEQQTAFAQQQQQLADQKRREALSAEALARQRELEAKAAQRATQVQFEDATLRRIAAESRAMLDGTRAGGALMAVRLALAGLALQPRADQFGTLQVALAAGDGSQRAWEIPGETISAMALSPDGALLATASENGRSGHLRFWRATGPDTGTPVGAAIPITRSDWRRITRMAFTPGGRPVAATGTPGAAQQWDVPASAPTATAAAQPLTLLTFTDQATSPAGDQWLVGIGGRNTLTLHTARGGSGVAPRQLAGHTGTVLDAVFSPDGQRIATSSGDTTIRLWDAATGQAIGEPLRGHTAWVSGVAFSPDGLTLASSSHDKTVRLWRVGDGTPVHTLSNGSDAWFDLVRFSPDGQRVAAASRDGVVRLWDAATGKPLAGLTGHRGRLSHIAFSPDGRRLLSSGDDDGSVRVWDGHGAVRRPVVIDAYKDNINSIALAPGLDSHRLAATSYDGTLRQWDLRSGQPAGPLIETPRNLLNAVTYSADGQRLVTASGDGSVRLWDAATGRLALAPMRGHQSRATAVASSPDGKLLASADDTGHVILWNATSGDLLRRLPVLRDRVWSVGFSPDSQRLAASGGKGLFVLWDTASGQVLHQTGELPSASFDKLVFSADSRFVAAADGGRSTLSLWDGRTGQPIERAFTGHRGAVQTVAFSPDGQFIASGGTDKTVRLWDVATGEPVGAPVSLEGWTSSLAFSADGQHLVVTSNLGNHTIHVLDGPAAWARLHCQRLTRNMSNAEWTRYVGKAWRYAKQCPNLPEPKE